MNIFSVSPALHRPLFTADAETIHVWMRSFAGIFHISFSPSTNVSILMLNYPELTAADDYSAQRKWVHPLWKVTF